MSKRVRTQASEPARASVKISASIARSDHAKIAWLAASTGRDRGELVAEWIAQAVRSVVVSERGQNESTGGTAGS